MNKQEKINVMIRMAEVVGEELDMSAVEAMKTAEKLVEYLDERTK